MPNHLEHSPSLHSAPKSSTSQKTIRSCVAAVLVVGVALSVSNISRAFAPATTSHDSKLNVVDIPPTVEEPAVPFELVQKSISQFLPATKTTKAQVFEYLQGKIGNGKPPTGKEYDPADPVSWFFKRYEKAPTEKQDLYRLAYEDLLAAQNLLAAPGTNRPLDQQRQGLKIAYYSSFNVGQKLEDHWLRARIYEGWILPNIHAGYEESWKDLSRQSLVERACASYKQVGEIDNQIQTLFFDLDIAPTPNTRDWARVKLAEALATQSRFTEAIEQLNSIESPEMSGGKKWIPELQKKLDDAKAAKAKPKQ